MKISWHCQWEFLNLIRVNSPTLENLTLNGELYQTNVLNLIHSNGEQHQAVGTLGSCLLYLSVTSTEPKERCCFKICVGTLTSIIKPNSVKVCLKQISPYFFPILFLLTKLKEPCGGDKIKTCKLPLNHSFLSQFTLKSP